MDGETFLHYLGLEIIPGTTSSLYLHGPKVLDQFSSISEKILKILPKGKELVFLGDKWGKYETHRHSKVIHKAESLDN